MKKKKFGDNTLYINRELSALAFNRRVLAQAEDLQVPLLERLRFLFICSSNLDEFFEIRVAGLKELLTIGSHKTGIDGLSAEQTLQEISLSAHQLVDDIYRVYNQILLPALSQEAIQFVPESQWNAGLKKWIKRHFSHEIMPILSPVALDLAHPFPRLVNKSLNFIVSLEGKDAFNRTSGLAVVHAPRALPRAIKIPDKLSGRGDNFLLLTSIITAHVEELFPGMTVTGCYQFRLTRNSDLLVNAEAADDLAHALKSELLSLRYGNVVRLEIDVNCPDPIADFLLKKHGLTQQDLYRCRGPVNLSRYIAVLELIQRDDLRYPCFQPSLPKRLEDRYTLFDTIHKGDILLHHPFQSFNLIVDFIRQATADQKVLAIKQTLYRTRPQSKVVKALIDAARAGKEVTAVIELRARFDEASNIELANQLQEAGALVVYGIVGFKTHAKLTLIVRREGDKLRRYAHLGTGNYHEHTAQQYTDISLLTYDLSITKDVQKVFQFLTGMGKIIRLKKLLYSPFTLHKKLCLLIEEEIKQAKKKKKSRIIIKVNGLTDPDIIKSLYSASQAGVKIDLIVRGVCCLKPKIKGVSDNIRVHSIIGRFLEHSRIYYFHHGGEEKIYCGSADCMERNFYHRVEVCFPIEDPLLKKRIKEECLMAYLTDDKQRWILEANTHYKKKSSKKSKKMAAQQWLLQQFTL